MDNYGLFPKFKSNRPLNEEEKKYQLKQGCRIDLHDQSVVPDIKVISMNSHYLELVDKYYAGKGVGTFISLIGFAGMVFVIVATIILTYFDSFSISLEDVGFSLIVFIPGGAMAIFMFILLKTECFAWTHYPVRYDRKNQLVHIFRLDGTTCSVPWERIFFTSGLSHRKDFNKEYYISGHILADDNQTVMETFCLPATHRDRKQLERHWEFVRRYMEEGPEAVIKVVNFCLPVAKKREGYAFGLLYLLSAFDGAPLFLFPLHFALAFIFSIPRYFAMMTSKMPVWPESIEAQCHVDKDDPYLVDTSINPPNLWRRVRAKSAEDKKTG